MCSPRRTLDFKIKIPISMFWTHFWFEMIRMVVILQAYVGITEAYIMIPLKALGTTITHYRAICAQVVQLLFIDKRANFCWH